MALNTRRLSPNQALRLSVLDRLIAAEDEAPRSGIGSLARLREGVRRDLEDLLNTRVRCRSWPAGLSELDRSLVNYGLPDFTGLQLGAPSNHEIYRRIIETAIEVFEPRLENVTVERMPGAERGDRILSFRIEATLRVEAYEEPISLDSRVEPLSASFSISRPDQ